MVEKKIRVPLLLAPHLADMLDNLCAWYDADRTNCLRRLILDDYDRILLRMGGKDITAKLTADRARKNDLSIVADDQARGSGDSAMKNEPRRGRKNQSGS